MTPGTSPHGGSLSQRWAGAAGNSASAAWPWRPGRFGHKIDRQWLARGAAALHLLALAVIVTMAWHDGTGAVAAADGMLALHLVFLMATGAATALLTLRLWEWSALTATGDGGVAIGSSRLLEQMSHDLRTPLNAVIGFSEVMQAELHGPLGDARYRAYAAHISESGGRLLKASEEALAVTATMSALMADRRSVRRERVPAATLVQEAWAAAAAGEPRREVWLTVVNDSGEIECDRRATIQALEHLLREAIVRSPQNGRLEARWRGDVGGIEIRVRPSVPSRGRVLPVACPPDGKRNGPLDAGAGLRELLARSLLEMQGATLSLCVDQAGSWSARVAFPTGWSGN